jgi:hypothetical protein
MKTATGNSRQGAGPSGQTTLGYRHEFARGHSGLSGAETTAQIKGPRKRAIALALATPAEFERIWDGTLADLVALAEVYRVDPRWLALGIVSPAGASALFTLDRAWKQKRLLMGATDRQTIVELLASTPEPDKGAGVCRYCLCSDECGCGDCYWLDAAATICSSCLEPEDL